METEQEKRDSRNLSGSSFILSDAVLDDWKPLMDQIRDSLLSIPNGSSLEPWIFEGAFNSFDTKRALINFGRFLEGLKNDPSLIDRLQGDSKLFEWLGVLFSGSHFLTDIALSDLKMLHWLFSEDRYRSDRLRMEMVEEIREDLSACKNLDEKMRALRIFKKRETLRIGLRDLKRDSDIPVVLEEISFLAEVCCEAARDIAWEEQRWRFGVPQVPTGDGGTRECGFLILGMGKLGGRELNFSSDIDLIYVYDSGIGETTQTNSNGKPVKPVTNHEFFIRLCRLITKILNDITEDGAVFRVDLDLRPEGRNGDIIHSLLGMEIYYQSFGQTWEKQIFIKARMMAGDRRLAAEFFQMIQPFTYPKHLDFSALKEIREMKEKINLSLAGKRDELEFNVKLGYGGIREIEFLVQAFQLVFGGREPWLREPRTLRALHKLSERGLLEQHEYSTLTHAYLFFRELENRIQISRGLQTHTLPKETAERVVLARTMGVSEETEENLAAKLVEMYKTNTENVRAVYNAFFHEEIEQEEESQETAEYLKSEFFVDLLEPGDAQDKLEKLGFHSPSKTLGNLVQLKLGGPYSPLSARTMRYFNVLVPTLLREALRQPDPDLAIQFFQRFSDARKESQSLFSTLMGNERIVGLLCTLFGRSKNFSEQLVRQPYSIDSILMPGTIERRPDKESLEIELSAILALQPGYEKKLDALIQFKQSENLLIVLRYLVHLDDLFVTRKVLSDLADLYLERCRTIILDDIVSEHGVPSIQTENGDWSPCRFALIAMGKLGRGEMGFGSDVDLMFAYSDAGETRNGGSKVLTNHEFYARLCEKMMRVAGGTTRHGFAYKVDARLRPEGVGGPLAQPYSTFNRYYTKRAGTWEKLALTGARVVAGDPEFGQQLMNRIDRFVYETEFGVRQLEEVQSMRTKMESENYPGPVKLDIKFGKGGLVDLEFMTQLMKIWYSKQEPLLRSCSTYRVLEMVGEKGFIDSGLAKELWDHYKFLAELETQLRLEFQFSANVIPNKKEDQRALAAKLGYGTGPKAGSELLGECGNRMKKVRSAFQFFLTDLKKTV